MKRSEANKVMEEKSYKISPSELFKVTFLKSFGAFKEGASTCVSLPVAIKWLNANLISETKEMKAAISGKEIEETVSKPKK